jgi:hypothetical protein
MSMLHFFTVLCQENHETCVRAGLSDSMLLRASWGIWRRPPAGTESRRKTEVVRRFLRGEDLETVLRSITGFFDFPIGSEGARLSRGQPYLIGGKLVQCSRAASARGVGSRPLLGSVLQ